MKRSLVAILGCLAAAPACTTHQGKVEEVAGHDEATVKLNLMGRVAKGDRVAVLETKCTANTPLPVSGANDCHYVPVGGGTVVDLADSRTAVVKVDPGVTVKPGMVVKTEKGEAH